MLSLICLFSVGLVDQLQFDSADFRDFLVRVVLSVISLMIAAILMYLTEKLWPSDGDSNQKEQKQASGNDQRNTSSPQVDAESNQELIDNLDYGELKPLGESEWNMAEVWLADDMPQKVVVKFPNSDYPNQKNVRYRFRTERELHGDVNHPNIVPCVVTGKCFHPRTNEKTPYLVQEYIEGYTIKQLLDKRGRKALPKEDIRDIAKQIRSAIYYLHAKNIVHRDLSWKNVMINKSGVVKIIDLGISTRIGSDRTKEMNLPTLGTPLFSPPTDFCSITAPNKDFYALAILIYLMLGGKVTKTDNAKDARENVLTHLKGLKGISEDAKEALRAYLTKNKEHDGDFKREFDQLMDLLLPPHSSLADLVGDVTKSSSLNV